MRPPLQDTKRSFIIVWLVLSLAILGSLAAPFLLGGERLAYLVPVCEWKSKYGRACPVCGMTTSFIDISQGRFGDASRANHAGIPLYAMFLSNEVCALLFARRKVAFLCKH